MSPPPPTSTPSRIDLYRVAAVILSPPSSPSAAGLSPSARPHAAVAVGPPAQGVKIVGTDAWSWDAPFVHTNKVWQETRDPSIIWEGHKAGREIGYFQMEKLHNLEALPSTGT